VIAHERMFLVLSAIGKLACLILFGWDGRQTPGVCVCRAQMTLVLGRAAS